jgi:hypothetical protein
MEATIEYELERAGEVEIELFDVLGRARKAVYSGWSGRGRQRIQYDASELAPGLYYLVQKAGRSHTVSVMVVAR